MCSARVESLTDIATVTKDGSEGSFSEKNIQLDQILLISAFERDKVSVRIR